MEYKMFGNKKYKFIGKTESEDKVKDFIRKSKFLKKNFQHRVEEIDSEFLIYQYEG